MVVRINNVSKWSRIEPGHALPLPGVEVRKIRVEVNCPAKTRFDVVEGEALTFLAVVEGYQLLEFAAGPDAVLVPTSEEEVWFFTTDGEVFATQSELPSFTTMMQRRVRNPQLELMMWKQEQNMRRREAAMAEEIAAFKASVLAQGANTETGEVENEAGGSAGAASEGEGQPPAGGAGGGADAANAGATNGAA